MINLELNDEEKKKLEKEEINDPVKVSYKYLKKVIIFLYIILFNII